MSSVGVDGGVDLVLHMHPKSSDDYLRSAYVHLDFVHRKVSGDWVTMGAPMFSIEANALLTIATMNVPKDCTETQVLFWTLGKKAVAAEHPRAEVLFYGCMGDAAGKPAWFYQAQATQRPRRQGPQRATGSIYVLRGHAALMGAATRDDEAQAQAVMPRVYGYWRIEYQNDVSL
ncbi:hypothetical protein CYMTET_53705 [Cymbomonas tetramitiformis]|uniref:Uncharacterized protein n=1 Tax=Cymbomonas tetramitiformis TaxID=36881 RepID=A0AAE0EPG3_9CHLO|nr:hypothetical protein CYMTET_53705 [Cymbomonas tetramitiformis]